MAKKGLKVTLPEVSDWITVGDLVERLDKFHRSSKIYIGQMNMPIGGFLEHRLLKEIVGVVEANGKPDRVILFTEKSHEP